MDSSMNNFLSNQLHVAQQSRREKLRVQHCIPLRSGPHIDDYPSGLEVANVVQVGHDMRSNNPSVLYNHPTGCTSEMLKFNDPIDDQAAGDVNSINMVSSRVDGALKTRVESSLDNCRVWKSVSGNSSVDNWSTDSIGRYRKNNSLGIASDQSAIEIKGKHQQSETQFVDMNSYATQLHYQNVLSDGVTTAVLGMQPNFNARGNSCVSWGSYGGNNNDQVTNASFGYQSDGACLLSGSSWNSEMNLLHGTSSQMIVDSHSQGLLLSLGSYPMVTGNQYGNSQHIHQSIPSHNVANVASYDSKSSTNYRQTGPLGPFTGYATILKSSRFLKPAQMLLNEYCGVAEKFASSRTQSASDIDLDESGDLATAVNSIVSDIVNAGEMYGASAATQRNSDEIIKGAINSPRECIRTDYHSKKAKLLYMLDEVSKRYKHYYQQMQMVVSAFESVAGLSGVTPYISLALKAVSRHFNHLKNAISDQLKQLKTFLGEDFSLAEGDFTGKRLKYGDHSFQKNKSVGNNMGLLEPQQHIWRPQRGLPERAVSVLRAWLFEHFLHPYPTDTDKHMLATQTGLTRSQVSNWFINARVRLWKPMVEEVHMLETKVVADSRNINQLEDDVSAKGTTDIHLKSDHTMNELVGNSMANVNLECPATRSLNEIITGDDVCVAKQHVQDNLVQVQRLNVTTCMDNQEMFGISRYNQTTHDINGIGSISLTLGLTQSVDQLYQHQQHAYNLQQQDNVRSHLGGYATHD